MADGDYYSNKNDIYLVFGEKNSRKWAAIEKEDERTFVENRFDWSNRMSYSYINGRMTRGPYVIPFTSPYPEMIILLSATMAGLFLYDSRRIAADENPGRVPHQRKMANLWIRQIMGGQLKLTDATGVELTVQSEYVPRVFRQEDSILDTIDNDPFTIDQVE